MAESPVPPPTGLPLVGIIMGSDSDLPTLQGAIEICRTFGVPYEVAIVSAHRTPDRMVAYAKTAHERGLKVIIAGAGGAAIALGPRRWDGPASFAYFDALLKEAKTRG